MKLLEWLWRPQCAACANPNDGMPLCEACGGSLVLAPEPRAFGGLERAIAPWAFGGAMATAIRRFKYSGATQVARAIAPLWAAIVAAAVDEYDEPLIVPVPMHVTRRVARGYDHTWLLAEHVCRLAGVSPPARELVRVGAAVPQSGLSAAERAANLEGAFAVRDERLIAGRNVVLLDDVITTGATLSACAAPLLEAQAKRIVGIAVARTLLQ